MYLGLFLFAVTDLASYIQKCYPAEGSSHVFVRLKSLIQTDLLVFPTKYRAFAHGISAASGKVGAIISALAFNTLSEKIGTPAVLWSVYRLSFPRILY